MWVIFGPLAAIVCFFLLPDLTWYILAGLGVGALIEIAAALREYTTKAWLAEAAKKSPAE